MPYNLKSKIDVHLQRLINELKILWNDDGLTNDASKKKNFMLKVALKWTINDF